MSSSVNDGPAEERILGHFRGYSKCTVGPWGLDYSTRENYDSRKYYIDVVDVLI